MLQGLARHTAGVLRGSGAASRVRGCYHLLSTVRVIIVNCPPFCNRFIRVLMQRSVRPNVRCQSSSLQPFHLAFPVRDVGEAKEFYGAKLGLQEGRSAKAWVDYSLFGNQIVCHHIKGYNAANTANAGTGMAVWKFLYSACINMHVGCHQGRHTVCDIGSIVYSALHQD